MLDLNIILKSSFYYGLLTVDFVLWISLLLEGPSDSLMEDSQLVSHRHRRASCPSQAC